MDLLNINTEEYLQRFKTRAGPKIEHSFQEIGVEMSKEFGKKVWPLFHKVEFTEQMIRDAWGAYKKGNVKNYKYFMAILLRKAGLKK